MPTPAAIMENETGAADSLFGVYVHWPFCLAKCPYCDFNSHVRARIDDQRWRQALLRELDHYAGETGGRRVTSVFFGGGTPSLMAPETTAAVIERIGRRWRLDPDAEITLEANPTSVEAARFAGYRAAGVNRLSLGVQALDDGALGFLSGAKSAGVVSPTDLRDDCSAAIAGAIGDWQIRPRALAQTMYARLFACDLFIHGIGGAKYDQITDDIIRSFFGIEPPAYACISATLRLPLRRYGIGESELRDLRRKARDLRYNPQRYLPDDRLEPEIRRLIAERATAIKASNQLRLEQPKNRSARLATFNNIRQANTELMRAVPDLCENTTRQITEIAARSAHNRITTSRDWFFALHPRNDLARLRATLRSELGEST